MSSSPPGNTSCVGSSMMVTLRAELGALITASFPGIAALPPFPPLTQAAVMSSAPNHTLDQVMSTPKLGIAVSITIWQRPSAVVYEGSVKSLWIVLALQR